MTELNTLLCKDGKVFSSVCGRHVCDIRRVAVCLQPVLLVDRHLVNLHMVRENLPGPATPSRAFLLRLSFPSQRWNNRASRHVAVVRGSRSLRPWDVTSQLMLLRSF